MAGQRRKENSMDDIIVIEESTKKDRGFTLIELLIVIVILGVLATVVVFAVGGITGRGQESACKAELKTLEVAVEAFAANDPAGQYPANTAALVPQFLRKTPELYQVSGSTITKTTAGTTKCPNVNP
jgi:prepilin-type N-terminal cleavage/methylation domain-containing protein